MTKFHKYRTHDGAFLDRMPAGIPGDLSRKEGAVVEAQVFDATNPPTSFGQFVALDSSSKNIRKVLVGDISLSIYGALLRPYPVSAASTNEAVGTATPNTIFPADVLKKGYFTTLLQNSTASARGGKVYQRIAATSGALKQGGIEAAAAATVTSPTIVGTGTGTIAATVGDATKIKPGTYTVTVDTTSNTSTLTVVDPDGITLKKGQIGVAYSQQGLSFTVTAAGTMTAGDTFSPVVTQTNIEVPSAFFMGPADSSGNVEVAYRM